MEKISPSLAEYIKSLYNNIPDYDYSKASSHRPWQKAILQAITEVNKSNSQKF